MCVLCALTLVLLVLSTQSLAQGYGSIAGTVADPTGAVVASATVTVTQTDTGRKTVVTSGPNGAFVFPALAPTDYMLTVAAKGFQNYMQSGVVLQADQSLTVRVRLELGAATQTIQVTTEVPQIDTTSGTLSQVIDESRVVDLPLNGRNAAQLVTLVAGVIDATNEGNGVNQGNGKTFPAAVVTSANGTLPNQSNYLLNGGNNVDEMTNVNGPFPFPDALQEFSVQTSNYNAEFGQSAGAVVNIVTKSGGKKFHGDLFEFLRNGYFNAKPYFATVADNYQWHHRRPGHHPPFLHRGTHSILLWLSAHALSRKFKRHFNHRPHPRGRRPLTHGGTAGICRLQQPVQHGIRQLIQYQRHVRDLGRSCRPRPADLQPVHRCRISK